MAQFPLSDLLTGAKRIYTSIMARKDDGTYQEMNIDNNGGIKTALVTELPTGTNNIGHVTIDTLPEIKIQDNAEGTPIHVTQAGNAVDNATLQPASSAAAPGNPFVVGSYKKILLEVSGTSTSRTIVFEGMGPSNTPIAILGKKLSDGSTASQTTGTGELWSVDIEGLTTFQANLTAVSGGTVTVTGTATL